MRQRAADFETRNAVVLVISFEAQRRVRGFARRHRLPFACLLDESRATYRAYGLGRRSWLDLLSPKTLAPYVRLALTGRGLPRAEGDQDVHQMGGDFVVGPGGRLALVHASDDPNDRPSIDSLLAAIDAGPERA